MTTRKYSSRAQQTTLASGITSGDVTMTVVSGSNLMGGKTPAVGETYTVVIDPDTSTEEIVDVSNYASGNTLTIARVIDGSTAVAHSAGAIVRHMVIGRDLTEANTHIEATTGHGATGAVVGTTNTQTLTNKTLTSPTINTPTITTPTISTPNITGTATAVNLTASGTVTAALFSGPLTGAVTGNVTGNVTGTVTGSASLNLLKSGDTMSGAIAMGANKITGLGTPTANTTDAANTAYVDAAISTAVTNVIASAPALLDTLDELAAALGDDANFATTVTTNLAAKANIASPTFTGVPAAPTASVNTNTTQIATTAYVMAATVAPSNLTGPITSSGSATSIASQTGTGTKFVVDTSPTLVTPVLGVATATSINGTTIPSSVTLVKTADTLAVHSSTTSAQLAGVVSDETGSGSLVFATLPTFGTTGVKFSGSTSGTTTVLSGATAGTSVLTLPVATDTLVGKATTDTLTNKTLTAPLINTAFNAQTGTTYTLVAADSGKLVSLSNAAGITLTVPISVYAAGEQINIIAIGAGQVTLAAASGATIVSTGATSAAPKLRVQYSAATIICQTGGATPTFYVVGDLS